MPESLVPHHFNDDQVSYGVNDQQTDLSTCKLQLTLHLVVVVVPWIEPELTLGSGLQKVYQAWLNFPVSG